MFKYNSRTSQSIVIQIITANVYTYIRKKCKHIIYKKKHQQWINTVSNHWHKQYNKYITQANLSFRVRKYICSSSYAFIATVTYHCQGIMSALRELPG